jgi:hypothetical protein
MDLVRQMLADWLQKHCGDKVRTALPIVEDGFTATVHGWYGGETRSGPHG